MSKKARRVHPGLRRSSAQAKHRTRRANTADQVAARQLVIGSKLEPPPGGKRVNHWDGIIQSYETEPSAETQAFEVAIDAGVAAFGTQKDNLLAVLLNAYERGPKSNPFHADRAWDRLERMAWLYFWRKRLEHEGRPARDRSKRLRKIANVLGKACRLFDEAKQDALIDHVYSAWCDQNVRDDTVPEGPLVLVRLEDEFDKVLAALSTLEAATLRALEDKPNTKPGPAAALQSDFIEALATMYLELTGREPGAGLGPFYRFVMNFRAAIDLSYKTKDESGDERVNESMVGDIKKALPHWKRRRGLSTK